MITFVSIVQIFLRQLQCYHNFNEPTTSKVKFKAKLKSGSPPLDEVTDVLFHSDSSDHFAVGIGEEFPNLQKLGLFGDIKFLTRQGFSSMSKLEEILMNNIPIEFLPGDLLMDLPELRMIWITNTHLAVVENGLFRNNFKIKTIRIVACKLKQIQVDFSRLSLLSEVYLMGNECISWPFHHSFQQAQDKINRCCDGSKSTLPRAADCG